MGLFAWGWWGPRGEGGPLDLGVGGSHIGQCTYRDSGQLWHAESVIWKIKWVSLCVGCGPPSQRAHRSLLPPPPPHTPFSASKTTLPGPPKPPHILLVGLHRITII